MGKRIKEYENENATQVALLGRKYQSVFVTSFVSEKGDNSKNNSYFSYVELDDFGCWLVVDGDNKGIFKEQIASYIGESIIESFIANPTIKRRELEKMLISIHKKYRNMQLKESKDSESYTSCSIAMVVTDYTKVNLLNIGNTRYGLLRNNVFMKKSCDDSLAYLQYEAGNILYDEIRFRKDKNILTQRFGIDRGIKISISESFQLKPKDKILLCTQGAWENLSDEDIEIISESSERVGKFVGTLVNQMKKSCFHKLNNYTICGIYVERPLIIPAYSNIELLKSKAKELRKKVDGKQVKKIIKNLIYVVLTIAIISGSISLYKKLKVMSEINHIKNEIAFNIDKSKKEIQEKNYSKAINNYQNLKGLYSNLENYEKVSKEKIEEIEFILIELNLLNKVKKLYDDGDSYLNTDNFNEAIKSFEEAILTLENVKLDSNMKEKLNEKLEIAKKLLETQNLKNEADKLYAKKPKKAIGLYKNILPIYEEYNKEELYNEVTEKIKIYEDNLLKSKENKVVKKLPIYDGDIKFKEYKYYSSLTAYENDLKKAKASEEKEYLNGKINMNKQLLKAVELELKGDKALKNGDNKDKIKDLYEEALIENKKLENNKYIPKARYKAIIKRVEIKLKKLQN